MVYIIKNLKLYEPKNEYSKFIKQYYTDIFTNGTQKYIKNINVEVKILDVNGTLIPITIGNNIENNCFSVSILGMFKYLLHESSNIKGVFLQKIIAIFSKFILFIINSLDLYKVVFVNNNLLSTNIYPNLTANDFKEIKEFLLKKYPNFAIIFRSVNETNTDILDILKSLGFKDIIFRQVFLSYKNNLEKSLRTKECRADKNHYLKSDYEKITKKKYSDDELLEISKCYNHLYLEKYSYYNPQLTLEFYKNIMKNDFFSMNVLKNSIGEINGTYCYFYLNNQATAPIFGYKKENLYRYINYCYLSEIFDKVEILNWSSGVGYFKTRRGAEKTTEYFMIYFSNLPFLRRLAWNFIYFFSKKVGEPYLKKNVF